MDGVKPKKVQSARKQRTVNNDGNINTEKKITASPAMARLRGSVRVVTILSRS